MSAEKNQLSDLYTQLLLEYVKNLEEAPLAALEALGEKMIAADMPNEEVGEIHDCAMARLLEAEDFSAEKIRAASQPLMQLLIVYSIAAYRVTNAKKKADQELEKYRNHLEERVRERTEELHKTVNLMAGREVRMAELKKVIKQLCAQLEDAGLVPVADGHQ